METWWSLSQEMEGRVCDCRDDPVEKDHCEAGGEVITVYTVSVQERGGSWDAGRKDGFGQECVDLYPGMAGKAEK